MCHSGAVVAEGGRVMIDRSKLDASNLLGKVPEPHRKDHHILYRLISLPRHGALSIRGHNFTRCFVLFFLPLDCFFFVFSCVDNSLLTSTKPFTKHYSAALQL